MARQRCARASPPRPIAALLTARPCTGAGTLAFGTKGRPFPASRAARPSTLRHRAAPTTRLRRRRRSPAGAARSTRRSAPPPPREPATAPDSVYRAAPAPVSQAGACAAAPPARSRGHPLAAARDRPRVAGRRSRRLPPASSATAASGKGRPTPATATDRSHSWLAAPPRSRARRSQRARQEVRTRFLASPCGRHSCCAFAFVCGDAQPSPH
mmetsp:Transcript_27392/g.80238  ORF Transcript_27392/g.80238 Transcript_27392/m.80238 type:complete len:212 (+) Transcript_27392:1137-1772(+)